MNERYKNYINKRYNEMIKDEDEKSSNQSLLLDYISDNFIIHKSNKDDERSQK